MMNRIAKLAENDTYHSNLFAVVFDNFYNDRKNLKYRIRWRDHRGKIIESPFPTIPAFYQSCKFNKNRLNENIFL